MQDTIAHNVARASILVTEAWRQESEHLRHQKKYLEACIQAHLGSSASMVSPSDFCACCSLPLRRTLDARGRAENFLRRQYSPEHVTILAEQLVKKYEGREAYLMDELAQQFGPEPLDDTYEHRLESIHRKLSVVNEKWKKILKDAKTAAQSSDYSNVIRHLSVMRIFLEGSQALSYSCDPAERERRDRLHVMKLQQLGITPST